MSAKFCLNNESNFPYEKLPNAFDFVCDKINWILEILGCATQKQERVTSDSDLRSFVILVGKVLPE